MNKRDFRKLVFRIHTWLGLHLCLVLGLIFLTGTLLLYSPELLNYRNPTFWIKPQSAETNVSMGAIYDTVKQARPQGEIYIIATQPRPWFGRPVYGADESGGFVAQVNPHTGDLVGFQEPSRLTFRQFIRRLHDSLFVPISLAQSAVNALSFAVLALVATGLVTYRRFWKGFFRRPPPGADARTRSGMRHRLVAVWVTPFLLASALASSVFFLNSVGIKAEPPPAPIAQERATRLPVTFDGKQLDMLVTACTESLPTFVDRLATLPETPLRFVEIMGYDSLVGQVFGAATCYADPESGEVVQVSRASEGNWMVQVKAAAIEVHYGTWAGWASILLWTLCGAAAVYLVVTGARVFAIRIVGARVNTAADLAKRGTLSLLIDGLGVFKWAYLLLILGIFAIFIRDIM